MSSGDFNDNDKDWHNKVYWKEGQFEEYAQRFPLLLAIKEEQAAYLIQGDVIPRKVSSLGLYNLRGGMRSIPRCTVRNAAPICSRIQSAIRASL